MDRSEPFDAAERRQTTRRLLVLYHTNADAGRMSARLARFAEWVPPLAGASVRPVGSVDDAGDVIARHDGAVEGVIAAGGDGTVGLIAAALLAHGDASPPRLPLGVIPLGTGNAFAHGIGVGSLAASFGALGAWRETCIDVMRTTHPQAPVALVTLSAGVEGRFIDGYARRRARWSRPGAALAAAAAALRGARPRVRLVVDGLEMCDAGNACVSAGVYNFPAYAFGRRVLPDADLRDGLGEAVVCRTLRGYSGVLGRGLHTERECDVEEPRWTRFRSALLETDEALQADGEPLLPGSISIRIDRRALRVLVPSSFQADAPR